MSTSPSKLRRARTARRRPGQARVRSRRRLNLETLEPRLFLAGDVFISEFMALNASTIDDEDGDDTDWIEIFNSGTTDVDLAGWHLTDDADRLDKWTFPSVVVPGGGFLVVFASNKDRAVSGSQLHTNFSLSGDGEYLALSEPGGATVASEFAPGYPKQFDDISYGVGQAIDVTTLVPTGADARIYIPTVADAGLGTTWTEPGFNDRQWTTGPTGVGYETTVPGFAVRNVKANTSVGGLSAAEAVLSTPALQSSVVTENAATINYLGSGAGAHFGGDRAFPGATIGPDINDFVVEATGVVTIPTAGDWTFGVNSDDGFSLELSNGATTFSMSHDAPRAPADTFSVFEVTTPGAYNVRFVFYERAGGAEVELFAAQGVVNSFNSSFSLVGDVADGGLAVESSVVGGGGGGLSNLIATDVEGEMRDVNASVYVRIPFEVADPSELDSLTLRMKYDDGFVAFLNGHEIARRNAPTGLAWNSTATTNRADGDAQIFETIGVSQHLDKLVPGANVLAIQGLNDAVDGNNFLVLPELVEITVVGDQQRYFGDATPGDFNSTSFFGVVGDTTFSVDRGFYDAPFTVEVTSATPDAVIRYTLDGGAPTENSGLVYTGPIRVDRSTTLRAAAFKEGFLPTNVDTHTYIFTRDVRTQTGAGFPQTWGSPGADYAVDPNVVNDPRYRDTFEDDLKTIPTMSLVMDMDDLFDPSRGIYTHATNSGDAWERPGSLELIYPDGTEGFQVNQGVRMQGNVGRQSQYLKHSFRFVYKREYGPSKLRFPLFEDSPVTEFDNIILRAGFNNSYVCCGGAQNNRASFIRDQWSRDAQREMGNPSSDGTFVHLYINGLYWGLYNAVERPNAAFASSHLGGEKEDWDSLNSLKVLDGDRQAWDAMRNMAAAGLSSPAAYQAIQDEYLDVDNLIDYMLLNFYGGNQDWDDHNWYSGRRRGPGEKWYFFVWDAERTLESIGGDNKTGVSQDFRPSFIYSKLRENAEFRLRFADRVQKHMFNGGVLSVEANQDRWMRWANEIDRAVVGESARWGDVRREPPYTRDVEWINEQNRLINDYFPQRHDAVIAQLRAAGLYPTVDAPRLTPAGGVVGENDTVTMTSTASTVFTDIVPRGSMWRYLDNGSNQLTAWREPGFDDSAWRQGRAELGYGDGGEATTVGFGGDPNRKFITTYFRHTFNMDRVDDIETLVMRIQRDDGAVIYLNGEELERPNMPFVGDILYDTTAREAIGGGEESTFFQFDVDPSLLVVGENTLAVEIHQANERSSDISFDFELLKGSFDPVLGTIYYTLDGADPRLEGGAVAPGAILYDGDPLALDASMQISARSRIGSEWSPLNAATFIFDPPPSLRVTEIMYHPADPEAGSPYTDNDFEYIEVANVGAAPLPLTGLNFANGVAFVFPAMTLAPGEHVVVVSNRAAFESRYGGEIPIAGEYTGSLNNGGERILLAGVFGETILDFRYDDAWQPSTDGPGRSLVFIDPSADRDAWGDQLSWRPSSFVGGSPGAVDPIVVALLGDTNGDGRVDLEDLNNVRNNFGGSGLGDANNDGLIDLADLNNVRNNFGAVAPAPASPTPRPQATPTVVGDSDARSAVASSSVTSSSIAVDATSRTARSAISASIVTTHDVAKPSSSLSDAALRGAEIGARPQASAVDDLLSQPARRRHRFDAPLERPSRAFVGPRVLARPSTAPLAEADRPWVRQSKAENTSTPKDAWDEALLEWIGEDREA